MITIPADKVFQLSTPIFALQKSTGAPEGDVTLSISVDGTNFTALEETFSGTKVFHNYPAGLYLKCDKAVYFTGNIETPLLGTSTITVTAPAHGQIKVVDYRTKQPVNLSAVPNGTQVECIWFDTTSKWRFDKWTIGGVDYTDERPVVTLTTNTTIAITLTELPR